MIRLNKRTTQAPPSKADRLMFIGVNIATVAVGIWTIHLMIDPLQPKVLSVETGIFLGSD